jgi:hypothetical protein
MRTSGGLPAGYRCLRYSGSCGLCHLLSDRHVWHSSSSRFGAAFFTLLREQRDMYCSALYTQQVRMGLPGASVSPPAILRRANFGLGGELLKTLVMKRHCHHRSKMARNDSRDPAPWQCSAVVANYSVI